MEGGACLQGSESLRGGDGSMKKREKKSNGACGGSHLPGGILPGYGHVSGAVGGDFGGWF